MKRCIAAFLLLLVLLQCGGLWWCYKVSLLAHRQSQARVAVENCDMKLFKFAPSEFQASKVSDTEIEVAGVMYDVQSLRFNAGAYEVIASEDNWESEFMVGFDNLMQEESDENESEQILNFSFADFILDANPLISVHSMSIGKSYSLHQYFGIIDVRLKLSSPPPESFVFA